MATTKKAKSKGPAKKAAPKAKKAAPKAAKKPAKKASAEVVGDMDRKGLAGRARQLKSELLAIRFNLQAPNLNEYRKKRRELASVLAQLA